MENVVHRLRLLAERTQSQLDAAVMHAAADAIERLQAETRTLRNVARCPTRKN